MGFKKSWERFSQKLYSAFGSKLQGWYNTLSRMDLSPEVRTLLQKLCDSLPEKIVKGVMAEIVDVYRGRGREEAETKAWQILEIAKRFTF